MTELQEQENTIISYVQNKTNWVSAKSSNVCYRGKSDVVHSKTEESSWIFGPCPWVNFGAFTEMKEIFIGSCLYKKFIENKNNVADS